MTAYRRKRVPGGTYFFTVGLAPGAPVTLTSHIHALRAAYARTHQERPFHTDAIVVLPDHIHAVWTLPEGDADYSIRWRLIKARFTRAAGRIGSLRASQLARGERGIWQRRFWEHTIRDSDDYDHHLHYCWQNPVLHGLARAPTDWPHSSIHRDTPRLSPGVTPVFRRQYGEPLHPATAQAARTG